ncbi:hypothetical protein HYT02_03565 [Candidatus Gottesmanbacteria bacterium]|nr:hypothetical protein [Candidatus Gottesmanbacteria bacterium]
MRRLQIYLPEETYQELRTEAYAKSSSIAEIVRKRVSKKNEKVSKVKKNPGKAHSEAMLELARLAEKEGWKGPRDLASRVDYYLYGEGSKI